MQLIFLGTAGDSYVTGYQLRASGGIIFKSEKRQFHIDPGPGALVRASENKIDIRDNDVLLVSHNHTNHANDVNAVIEAISLSGFDKRGILIGSDVVINGDENNQPILTKFHKECLLKYMVLKAGQRAGIDDIEIVATSTKHTVENIGFKILHPSITISYVSDTSYFAGIAEEHSDADILILNVVMPGSSKCEGNLNSEDAVKIVEKISPKLTIITHFGKSMLKEDPINEAREIQKKTGCQVIAAKDGMTIDPMAYSAISKQKRISSYK